MDSDLILLTVNVIYTVIYTPRHHIVMDLIDNYTTISYLTLRYHIFNRQHVSCVNRQQYHVFNKLRYHVLVDNDNNDRVGRFNLGLCKELYVSERQL
jgi:hypothetical protein